MSDFSVESVGHWRGNPSRFCEALTVRVKGVDRAAHLADIAGLLASEDEADLAALAEAARCLRSRRAEQARERAESAMSCELTSAHG